jgi:diacylglycerol kinase (ATP)
MMPHQVTNGKPAPASAPKKVFRSFGYAFKGIGSAIKSQLNVRVHLLFTASTALLGWLLKISAAEWFCITLCIALVLSAELMNSAIETLVDLVSPEYNVKAGQVKDIAAGAVMIMAIFALGTGLVVFLPKLFMLIDHAA